MSVTEIRRAEPGDVEAINELHRIVNGRRRTATEWAWGYERGPWGAAHIWLACDRQRILGHWAWIPFEMRDGPRRFRAFKSEGLMVHPDARGRGVAGSMVRAALDSATLDDGELIWTFPNGPALTILTRAGYRDVGRIDSLLALRHPLTAAAARTPLGRTPVLRTTRGLDRLLSRGGRQPSPGWTVEPVERADNRFEGLWSRVADGCGLTVERSVPWLNWRFCDNPFVDYELVTAIDREGRCGGYAVLFWQQEGRLTFGYVSDWIVDDGAPGAAAALMSGAMGWFGRQQVDVVLAYGVAGGPAGYASLAAELPRIGPLIRRVNKTFIVRDAGADGHARRPITDWYVTESFTEGAAF